MARITTLPSSPGRQATRSWPLSLTATPAGSPGSGAEGAPEAASFRILEGETGSAAGFSDFGELRRLPLRDPMTLEPIGREPPPPGDDPADR